MSSQVQTSPPIERFNEVPDARRLRQVGPYELLGVLRGEMTSVVYLARQLDDGAPVRLAVVEVFDATLDPAGLPAFRALGRMRQLALQRDLPKVDHAGEDHDLHFIASEYVLGEPLARILANPVPAKIAADLVAGLADGCETLAGVCDPLDSGSILVPNLDADRIVLGYDGRARLTDISISARACDVVHQLGALGKMLESLLGAGHGDETLDEIAQRAKRSGGYESLGALARALTAHITSTDEDTDVGLQQLMSERFTGGSNERQHACREALRSGFDRVTVLPLLGAEPLVSHEFVRPEWLLDEAEPSAEPATAYDVPAELMQASLRLAPAALAAPELPPRWTEPAPALDPPTVDALPALQPHRAMLLLITAASIAGLAAGVLTWWLSSM